MLTSIRSLRPTLPTVLLALSSLLILPSRQANAQATTVIQHPFAIGLDHDMAVPYNFTGRVFDNENFGFGSGTLVRRHTILTAGHVVYDPTTGFTGGITFSRALYGTFSLSKSQASAVNVLGGYQTVATTAGAGNETLQSGARDLGYVLTNDAPIDDNWGNYLADPTTLTDNSGRFVLGYPGVSFNGRTMTYVVPTTPFVQVGALGSGFFQNEEFTTEPGNSGGPVYSVQNGQQYIVGELTSGLADPSAEFNASFVRAIDTEADQLLTSAEYSSGLISSIHIKGPATATRGTTVQIKVKPLFQTASSFNGDQATSRYKELTLTTPSGGTLASPAITITKINNKKFNVTFGTQLRSLTTVTFTVAYSALVKPGPIDPSTGANIVATTTTGTGTGTTTTPGTTPTPGTGTSTGTGTGTTTTTGGTTTSTSTAPTLIPLATLTVKIQ